MHYISWVRFMVWSHRVTQPKHEQCGPHTWAQLSGAYSFAQLSQVCCCVLWRGHIIVDTLGQSLNNHCILCSLAPLVCPYYCLPKPVQSGHVSWFHAFLDHHLIAFLVTLLLFQIVPCATEHRSKLYRYNINFMICITFHESDLWYGVTDWHYRSTNSVGLVHEHN